MTLFRVIILTISMQSLVEWILHNLCLIKCLRNTITWTSLIHGYSIVKDVESVFLIACDMYRLQEEFNEHTWSVILLACESTDDRVLGEQVHCVLIKNGFCEDVVVGTSLMSMYSRTGCLEDLEKLFIDLTCTDVRCCNLMISEYGRVGYSERAIQVFLELLNLGLEPDYYTLTNLLSTGNGDRDMDLGRQLHGFSVKHGFLSKTSVGNAMITMYGKHGLVGEAECIFNEMDNKNLVSRTAMLSVYVNNGNDDKAIRGFTKIMNLGIHPDSSCLAIVLDGCSETKNLVMGLQIHGIILKQGELFDVSVGTALIDIYTKCGKLQDARLVLNATDTLNIASFNAILAGFTMREDAMDLFNELRKSGIEPDSVTFARLFSLCADPACLGIAKSLHAFTIKTGFMADNKVGNAVITIYTVEKFKNSSQLFDYMRL